MNRIPGWLFFGLFMLPALACADEYQAAEPFAEAISSAQQRVVKLYGAALGREKAYGSGVLISADGRIVTTLSIMLEGRSLRAVLSDGRALPAQVLARDECRQLALLKIEVDDVPFFELTDSQSLTPGDWLIAAANPFKVADGPEPVSVSLGMFSARIKLDARHRRQDFSYDGPVLLTDIIVTTPGSAGGALLDADGRLVGVIGRAVTSKRTNTWINYALPIEEVARFIDGDPSHDHGGVVAVEAQITPPDLGIRLFNIGGRTRPAYVERIRPGSPARKAGLLPNDLIVSVQGEPVTTCADFRRIVATLISRQPLSLVVKRGDELVIIDLSAEQTEQ